MDEERIGLDNDELPHAKDAYPYIADRRLLGRIARLERESQALVHEPSLPIRAGVLPFHLEPSDWRAGYLSVYDLDVAPELQSALKMATPQALLRDLYRPMFEGTWQEREILVSLDPGGVQALRDARAAQKRDPLPRVEPLVHEVTRRAQAWRKVLRERWKPILDDSEPRKRVITFREPGLSL